MIVTCINTLCTMSTIGTICIRCHSHVEWGWWVQRLVCSSNCYCWNRLSVARLRNSRCLSPGMQPGRLHDRPRRGHDLSWHKHAQQHNMLAGHSATAYHSVTLPTMSGCNTRTTLHLFSLVLSQTHYDRRSKARTAHFRSFPRARTVQHWRMLVHMLRQGKTWRDRQSASASHQGT